MIARGIGLGDDVASPGTVKTLTLPLPVRLLDELTHLDRSHLLVLEVAQAGAFMGLAKFTVEGAIDPALPAGAGAVLLCSGTADLYHPIRSQGLGSVGLEVAVRRPPGAVADRGAKPAAALGSRQEEAAGPEPLAIRHTFDVQVLGLARLPPASAYVSAVGRPGRGSRSQRQPTGRFIRYFFPGETEPLETRPYPVETNVPVAASARHTITLPPHESLLRHVGGAGRERCLRFEVWTRWDRGGPDSLLASAEVPLAEVAVEGSQTFVLSLVPEPKSAEALLLRASGRETAAIRLQLGYFKTPLQEAGQMDDSELLALEARATGRPLFSAELPQDEEGEHAQEEEDEEEEEEKAARSGDLLVPAALRVEVIRSMGLQAAVHEAALYFGSDATPLLGRSSAIGPHSYVRLSLFPGDDELEAVFPAIRTPFQAQTFTPEYQYAREYPCQLDEGAVRALAVGEASVELWHHCPRSVYVAAHGPLPPAEAGSPAPKPRDVFLGSGSLPLAPLLHTPGPVEAWVPVKSRRGEPCGAVLVRLQLFAPGVGEEEDPEADPEESADSGLVPEGSDRPSKGPGIGRGPEALLSLLDVYPEFRRALPAGMELLTTARQEAQP